MLRSRFWNLCVLSFCCLAAAEPDRGAAPLRFGGQTEVRPKSPAGKSVGPKRWMDLTPEQLELEIENATARGAIPLPKLLLDNSEKFLETPYLASPLGEGRGKDPDPLMRFDAVDCLTFVEETIALSQATHLSQVKDILREIRYAQQPTYEDRNHLMEAQWIPNNVKKGFLRTFTRYYGREATLEVSKELSERTWASKSAIALGLPKEKRPIGKFSLSVVPLEKFRAIAPRVDSGMIVVIVREDLPFKVTRVSHVGFLVHKGQRAYLRHATRSVGKVVDEDLESFLVRNSKYAKWKVVGVSLFEVTVPPEAPENSVRNGPALIRLPP